MSKITKEPTGPYNPFYGCAIMVMAALIFGGMIGWSIYSFTQQDAQIAKFTVEHPVQLIRQTVGEAGLPALKARLNTFAEAALAARPATLTLTVPELNSLIELAPDTGFGNFKEMIAVTAVKPDNTLVAEVCLPLNKAKFWEGKRYAVGEAAFVVEIVKDTGPDLRLTSLTVPGKVVSPGFIEAFSSWRWLTPYQKMAAFTPVMKGIKKISVTSAGVVLSTE